MTTQTTSRTSQFRSLHKKGDPVLLANVWDAGSARIFEDLGAKAVATTSAGLSWAAGFPDGDKITVDVLVQVVKNIARVIKVPLTVDVESGYCTDPKNVAENIKQIIDAGAVGINIEDGDGSPDLLAKKIEAIRKVTSSEDLFINARTDVFLRAMGSEESRVKEVIERAAKYKKAGADGLFVPAVVKADDIRAIIDAVGMPVNVIAWAGLPALGELKKLGVSRLSAGGAISQAVWKQAADMVDTFLKTGQSQQFEKDAMEYGKLQSLFADR